MFVLKLTVLSVFVLSGVGAAVATRRARRLAEAEVRRGMTALLALTAVWALLEAGRVAVGFAPALAHAAYVAGLVVGLASVCAWLYFCSAYAGLNYHRDRGLLALGGALYVAVVGLKLTNPIHGTYYSAAVAQAPFPHLSVVPGAAHWIVVAGVYLLVGAGFVALWGTFRRAQADTTALSVLSVVTLLPLAPEIAAVLWSGAIPGLNYEPLGVAVFGLGALYAVEEEFVTVGGVARRQVVDDLESAVVVLDRDRRVVDANAAAESLFPDLTAGQPIAEVHWAVDERLRAHGAPTAETDGGTTAVAGGRSPTEREPAGQDTQAPESAGDVVTVEVDGASRHYLCRTVDVDLGDRTVGWAVVLSDVTELEARRRELRRQNEQLDDFAAAITHELRNPLSVVQGYADVLGDEPDAATEARAREEIRDAADRMTVVVDELTTLAERGRTVTDTGRHRLSRVVDSLADDAVVTGDGLVTANGTRLREMLTSVREYASNRGATGVSLTVERDHLRIALHGDVDVDDARRLLQYGYAGAGEQTRLSLANVRALARAHGWTVSVECHTESAGDRGLAFVFGGVETRPSDDTDRDGSDHDHDSGPTDGPDYTAESEAVDGVETSVDPEDLTDAGGSGNHV
jgi:signal transduction histidine kinase